jgi:uncharacterized protein (TIGR03000 family)
MYSQRTFLSLSGIVLLSVAPHALAQSRHSAPAPRPSAGSAPLTTGRDVLRAYGLTPTAGLQSGAPLAPRTGFFPAAGGYSSAAASYFQLPSAPNNYFPSRTTGFSTAPLFPYSSPTFPYGYGYSARDIQEEEPHNQRFAATIEAAPDVNSATMNVHVPAGAEIWFEGVKTGQRGDARTFVSPPLEPGRGFTYEIRARWTEDGKAIEQTRPVHVHAGESVDVNFAAKK